MAGPQLPADPHIVGERQDAARRVYAAVPDDHSAVVQRRFVEKDVADQLRGRVGVHNGAGLDDLPEFGGALKHHQRPHLLLLEGRNGPADG